METKSQQPRQPNSGRQAQIARRKSAQQKDSTVPSKYILEPGASVDYEVDYEEEAQQLIMTSREELVRKQDFIDIVFDEQRSSVSAHNLGNLRPQTHVLSEAPFDCIQYGMTICESRISKTFVLRQPFIVQNHTSQSYMLRIELGDDIRTQSLAPGEHYPLSHEDLQAKIRFAWLDDY